MLMGNDKINKKADAGNVKGTQRGVAVGVWYTATGVAMPKLIRYQLADQSIKTIYPIYVTHHEKKNYCGIPAIEYFCSAVIDDLRYEFKLIFYVEKGEWKIVQS